MKITLRFGLVLMGFGVGLATLDAVPAPLAVVVFLAGVAIVGAVMGWLRLTAHVDSLPTVADLHPELVPTGAHGEGFRPC